jgi:pimeloyl-ACP methyl ester carboxylesterase
MIVTQTRMTPTAEQLAQTKQAIDRYITSIDQHPNRRDGAYPYYLFHEPDRPILGTVMMFHGFSNRPHQMWRLADYLFRNGFNVYQVSLAGHSFLPTDPYWPQIDLKPEYAEPLKQKVKQDPVLMSMMANMLGGNPDQSQNLSLLQKSALSARLLKIEPQLLDIKRALETYDDPDFDRYFISSHENYLIDARSRLAELDAMPGPIYSIGLSVGGAVALALAADQSDRIKGVVAYAPFLEVFNKTQELYINIAGPLDLKETGWDPKVQFTVGCLTANNRFGDYLLRDESIQTLKQVPTCLILTENEDAADVDTNQQFTRQLGGESQGHYSYLYPTEDLVPHPMVDPTEVSQGMTNRYWQSMYQETYRFLIDGTLNPSNMSRLEQDPSLPTVPELE